eukprot:TRINITY_DN13559_c1_g1_i2.p1 TRINITY_DN13559_c1_g1~~TRINITY_DN13559_c1_g1_i2.p1  ORF type:complete len:632 (+),score=127.08 TRINITY_DN13559_c1_g1_i2:82-1977(+)
MKRLQVVLDLDNTLVHCGWDRENNEVESISNSQSIYEIWKSLKDQNTQLADSVYNKTYSFLFKEGRKEVNVYMKVRRGVFELLSDIRKHTDVHMYSKGALGYVTAALDILLGKYSDTFINGSIVTKDEDPAAHKDIKHILPPDLTNYAVIIDDQPAVWLQALQVLPSPPFHEFSSSGTVTPSDKVMEQNGGFLKKTSEHISLISNCISVRGCDAVEALRWLRGTAFYRMTASDGRQMKLLVVAVRHLTESENAAHRHKLRDLCNIVMHYGGEIVAKPHPDVTHVVTDSSDPKWSERCAGRNIHTVQVQWLVDTILYLQRMEECHYNSVQVRRTDLRSILTVRSCEFLSTFSRHCLPSIVEETRMRKSNVSTTAAAASVSLVAAAFLYSVDQKWLQIQDLFELRLDETARWQVTSVPPSSSLSSVVMKGDTILELSRGEVFKNYPTTVGSVVAKFEATSMETITIVVERDDVKHDSRVVRVGDHVNLFGLKSIQFNARPTAAAISKISAVSAALLAAATTSVGGYSLLTVRVRQHLSHPPSFSDHMVLQKVGCFPRFCLNKQLVTIDNRLIADRIDYHRNRLRCSSDSVFLFRGVVVVRQPRTKNLLPPPRPVKRQKREPQNGNLHNQAAIN